MSLVNCTLVGNRAIGSGMAGGGVANAGSGGGAVGCMLRSCVLDGNSAIQTHGGGARDCILHNCFLTRNSAPLYGGVAYTSTLVNCTVTGNTTGGYGASGGAVASSTLTNRIALGNSVRGNWAMPTNYYNCTMAFCNTIPALAGPGNISVDPQLLADGQHLAATSPCRYAGTSAAVAGTDLDGQPWANPCSIGCDESNPEPLVILNPHFMLGTKPTEIIASVQAAGQEAITYYRLLGGSPISSGVRYSIANSDLLISGFGPDDAGAWSLVTSNSVGMATGLVSQLRIHCVAVASTTPAAPFSSWSTAATNTQDAIDAASVGGLCPRYQWRWGHWGQLVNTTVLSNSARLGGGGLFQSSVTNLIAYFNSGFVPSVANCFPDPIMKFQSSCTYPLPVGAANISHDPQLLDGYHLAVTSPCRGAGTNLASGVDLAGEPWANPPSMGCAETWEATLTGPLTVGVSAAWPVVAARGVLSLTGSVSGRAARVAWDFGDGTVVAHASLLITTHFWTNAGSHTVTLTAFNVDHPNGVPAAVPVQVVPLVLPTLVPGGLSDTNFALSFPGQPGVTYAVERATNLAPPVAWQTLTTLTSTGQVMQVLDASATNATRCYRTRLP